MVSNSSFAFLHDPAFLSASGHKWGLALDEGQHKQAERLAQLTGRSLLICQLLVERGISENEAESYFAPRLRDLLPDPYVLQDMEKGAEVIARHIMDGRQIAVFGDFDVDGATSVALVVSYLRGLGLSPNFYIPDRLTEGYGPNPDAMRALRAEGADLCLMLDCGTVGHEALIAAQEFGLKVVVIDHHQAGESLPSAEAIINPNREDDLSGLGHLCAVGVSFLVLVAVNRGLRQLGFFKQRKEPNLLQMLDLVALGTVCDVVPLKGLNRAFVVQGLKVLEEGHNSGLLALRKAARADGPPNPYHLGFLLGPRINAGGRIGESDMGARLLLERDAEKAGFLAAELDTLNAQRQAIEKDMLEEALASCPDEMEEGTSFSLVSGEGWHPGIVGLVAARLKERFHAPAFAIAFDEVGFGSGSARSIAGVDLGRIVRGAVEQGLLLKGGGHAMAAGFKIEHGQLDAFRAYLHSHLQDKVADLQKAHKTLINGQMSASAATMELLGEVEAVGPYGSGNSEPVFLFPDHLVTNVRRVGADHISLLLRDAAGKSVKAISFRSAERPLGQFLQQQQGQKAHILGTLKREFWQGRQSVSLHILDAASST